MPEADRRRQPQLEPSPRQIYLLQRNAGNLGERLNSPPAEIHPQLIDP